MTRLSKSLYLAGRQCDRRLWLEVRSPETATPPGDAQRHILEQGTEVGRAARELFPNGTLVEGRSESEDLFAATAALMADASVPALFEAAFEHKGVRIRVDVLERLDGGRWGIREVKSATAVKPDQHIPDLAIQRWVLQGCGIQIDSAELIHVDSGFVRGPGEIAWRDLFNRVELIDELGDPIDGDVEEMRHVLAEREAPFREPGSFCKKPHLCSYWESCTASKPPSWFVDQMRARAARKTRMLDAIATGRPWFSDDLATHLGGAPPPVWALDFETIVPAIPLFAQTSPYQPLVFQWSLHRLSADGEIQHFEFLADGQTDPRPEVAQSLLDIVGRDEAPILVYSSYEKRCLKDLASLLPDVATQLDAVSGRLVDVLPIVRGYFYHPDFRDSFSIKSVAPALAPHVSYDDLDSISNGTAAMAAFAQVVDGVASDAEEKKIRADLLAYCERDTLALVEVYRALGRACGYLW